MTKAKLTSVMVDPTIFSLHGLSMMFPDMPEGLNVSPPASLINREEGEYTLLCGLETRNDVYGVTLKLMNTDNESIDEMFLPAEPMFAGSAYSMLMLQARTKINFDGEDDPEKEVKIFNWLAEGKPQDDAINKFMADQQAAFAEQLSNWFELENFPLANLMLHLMTSASPQLLEKYSQLSEDGPKWH